jgi:hypothetical protein
VPERTSGLKGSADGGRASVVGTWTSLALGRLKGFEQIRSATLARHRLLDRPRAVGLARVSTVSDQGKFAAVAA